nr:hypothetical protein Itr_chr12CG23600 [Ipomoea trifida]
MIDNIHKIKYWNRSTWKEARTRPLEKRERPKLTHDSAVAAEALTSGDDGEGGGEVGEEEQETWKRLDFPGEVSSHAFGLLTVSAFLDNGETNEQWRKWWWWRAAAMKKIS